MGGKATGQRAASPRAEARCPPGSEDDDCDDLYGDVNVGFLPLLPLSPSPGPTSPPKTPSPGRTLSPSPPPHRAPAPESGPVLPFSPSPAPKTPCPGLTLSQSPPPHRAPTPVPLPVHDPEPQSKPSATQYQMPRASPPAAPRHQMPQSAPRPRGDSSSSSPPGSALYISDLPWWATDAEVEAALALVPDAAPALRGLFFYSDKFTGKSRGICRAEFLSPAAAASAAAALHGRAFHGRNCVASLSHPPALNRLGDDSNAEPLQAAPNPSRGRGTLGDVRGASNWTHVRGNVGPILGDRSVQAPLPQLPMAPRPHGLPFAGTMGGGGGYGEFQPLGQFNAAMGTGMMPPAVAPHFNPAFLAAAGMAMRGPRVWPDEAMDGGFWGAQLPWNFKGCQLPWQRPAPTMQAQQQHGEWNFGKGHGMRGGRPGRSEEKGTGNVRRYPERRQSNSNHDGGDLYKEHGREEKSRRRERAPEKEREPERHWDEGDRRRGDKRRYQEYSEDNDDDRRVRARARSQSRNDGYDDHPRRRH